MVVFVFLFMCVFVFLFVFVFLILNLSTNIPIICQLHSVPRIDRVCGMIWSIYFMSQRVLYMLCSFFNVPRQSEHVVLCVLLLSMQCSVLNRFTFFDDKKSGQLVKDMDCLSNWKVSNWRGGGRRRNIGNGREEKRERRN